MRLLAATTLALTLALTSGGLLDNLEAGLTADLDSLAEADAVKKSSFSSRSSISSSSSSSSLGGSGPSYQPPSNYESAPQPQPQPHQPQQSNIYTTPANYGYKTKCYPHYESVPQDKCEPYTEKVCRTTQKETCKDIPDKNCKAIVSSGQVRKCFNVQEVICSLKEDIKYEVIQVPYAIQKCHKVPERVCDTVYETKIKTKEDYPCLKVENPSCVSKNYPVYDKTCKSTTYFDCNTYYYGQGASVVPSKDSGAAPAYGGGDKGYEQSDYGGYEQTYCHKTPDTKCYQTPRTVTQQKCYHKPDKICEKLTLRVPSVVPKQNCHTEYKKVCALEEHTEPKQVKKYTYQKQCKKVPRTLCENADVKKLVPSCVKTARKSCSYKPTQKCDNTPKKYCYKVYKKVRKDKCEQYAEPTTSTTTYAPGTTSYEERHIYNQQKVEPYGQEQQQYGGYESSGSSGSGSESVSSVGSSSSSSGGFGMSSITGGSGSSSSSSNAGSAPSGGY